MRGSVVPYGLALQIVLGACTQGRDVERVRGAADLLSPAELQIGLHGFGADTMTWVHFSTPRGDTAARLASVALWRLEGGADPALTKRLLCAALTLGVEDSDFYVLAGMVFDQYQDTLAVNEVAAEAARRWPRKEHQRSAKPPIARARPLRLPTLFVDGTLPGHRAAPLGCRAILADALAQ